MVGRWRPSLLMGILWLPAWHVLSAMLWALLPLPSLSFFSFRRRLRRILLPEVGVRGVRGNRGDWQGANWYRLSTKAEEVEGGGI